MDPNNAKAHLELGTAAGDLDEAIVELREAILINPTYAAAHTRLGIVLQAEEKLKLEQDMSLFLLRDLTLDLCQSNPLPAVATPRSLDLAHLRTALWFHAAEKIDRFVTMDASQEQAAKELGLPV